jgi:lysophospholipase L1-like esterase
MLGKRLEIYAQKSRKPEALRIQINGQPAAARRIEHGSLDQWVIEHDQDIASADVRVVEPGLELYGLVAETQSGLTWETSAVVGVSNGSFRQFNPAHLSEQMQTRKPDLIVIMLGGNDAGNQGILTGDGKFYQDGFTRVVQLLRQGAPQAACLIMSPLDQGTLGDDGRIYSKRTIARIVELQRQISQQQGCAFWDTWGFMGGQNSFARWLEQGLAWTDLMHLTERGLNRVGQGFSNALIQSYEQHRSGQ